MAKVFTPLEAYAIVNLMSKELTGQDSTIQAVDPSSFISVGERIITFPKENVLGALTMAVFATMINVKRRQERLNLITETDSTLFKQIMREILVYSQEAQASGAWNTDVYTNFAPGYDNGSNGGQSVGTMWEQKPAVLAEMFFGGMSVWDDCLTAYEDQIKPAFTDVNTFTSLINAIKTEKENDISRQKDAYKTATLINFIAAIIDAGDNMPGSAVNVTADFNSKFGTSYTTAELKTTYLKDFLQYLTAKIKTDSDRLAEESVLYHWSPAKQVGGVNYVLNRQTPKADQRLLIYGPMFNDAEAQVFSEIFNPQYLDVSQGERVSFWQNINDPMKIKVTPAIPDFASAHGEAQQKGAEVNVDIVGVLFDKDALKTNFFLESATATPMEARKRYHNIWYHMARQGVNNLTRQAIVYYMADPQA